MWIYIQILLYGMHVSVYMKWTAVALLSPCMHIHTANSEDDLINFAGVIMWSSGDLNHHYST